MSFVIEAYEEVVATDTAWTEHSHPWHELLWNEHGTSTAVVGSQVWCITPTLGLWMPAGQPHSASAVAGTAYRAHFFRHGTVSALPDVPVAVEITPLLRLLTERLAEPDLSPASRAVTEAMVLDVLRPSPRALLVQLPTSPLLRPIVDVVRADPADQRTLTGWATALGCSTRTLTRAFRRRPARVSPAGSPRCAPSTPSGCWPWASRSRWWPRRSATARRAPSARPSGGPPA